jgi:hypothetical protein
VGNLNPEDQGIWGKLAPAGEAAPHLSVGAAANGLRVFANIETLRPFARFRSAWMRDRLGFVDFVIGLAKADNSVLERNPWTVTVTRRIQKHDDKGALIPRKFWYLPSAELSASAAAAMPDLLGPTIDGAARFADRGEASPEITVGRRYEPWQVLDDQFLTDLVADAKRTEEFFDWLGVSCR